MDLRLSLASCLAFTACVAAPAVSAAPPYVWAGGNNTCAIVNGAAYCWGANTDGQVGDGTFVRKTSPTAVSGLSAGVSAIVTSGAHSCAIVNGGAYCWGNNDYGQLGNGGSSDSAVPTAVTGLSSGVTAIGVGDLHSCAVHNAAVKCWGSGGYGQLGTGGSIFSSSTPVAVAGLGSGMHDVNAGKHHTCALATTGAAYCWGRGDSGEMGNGTFTYINQGPLAVSGYGSGSGVGVVTTGGYFSCAIRNGGAQCWGYGGNGQLGTGGTSSQNVPTNVSGLASGMGWINAGNGLHACAITSGGPKCWGANNAGQLGVPGMPGGSNAPIAVQGLPAGIVDISAGGLHSCASTETQLYCWGDNAEGQLGVGNQTSSVAPQLVLTVPPPPANPARLANISTRLQVLTGDDVMIGGLIIGGSTPKTVVVRARGPSMAAQGVTGLLANPMLQLYSGSTVIASNDNWQQASNASVIQSTGFAPSNANESAIMTTLNPGAYTAIVSGVGGTTGVAIVEAFEVDAVDAPFINIATRGRVQTGDNVMIAGFIIEGDGPQTVVVRARGPSLAQFGVTGLLANPALQILSGPTVIASNDNWQQASNAGEIQSSGFAPSHPNESAIRITLNPGAYTAIVSGVGNTTGVAIVEVFGN